MINHFTAHFDMSRSGAGWKDLTTSRFARRQFDPHQDRLLASKTTSRRAANELDRDVRD
jgi:hypothetical protein